MRIYKILVVFLIFFLLLGVANASEFDGIADNQMAVKQMADDNIYDSTVNGDIQHSYNGVSKLNAEKDALSLDDSLDDSQALDESNENLQVSANSDLDSQALMDNGESQVLESTKDFNGNSFSQLQNEIDNCNANDTIKLNNDIYQDGSSEISIEKSIAIDGNDHIIDAKGISGIFDVQTYVTLKNIVFKNAYGHAIFSSSNILISNCTFINNSAQSGGAVYIHGGSIGNSKNVTIEDCRFENNHAEIQGGAIYFSGENLTVNNCTFRNNSAVTGGAIYNSNMSFVSYCNFSNNSADFGGAVCTENSCAMTYCTFTDNSATGSGGAVYSTNNSKKIMECNFYNNHANDGGAIYWISYIGSIQYCDFVENAAVNNGGALFLKSFDLQIIEYSSFYKNTANEGGAFYCAGSDIDIYSSYFVNNSAVNGGAIYCINSTNLLDFCYFNYNAASLDAGAIFLNDSIATLEDSNLQFNLAGEKGAAIGVFSNNSYSQLNITSSTFLNNKAKSDSLTVEEIQGGLIVGFNGLNNFINAIYADSRSLLNLSDVTYWSGEQVNSDDELYNTGGKGHNIVLEIYNSQNELLINTTLTTNVYGEQYYDVVGIDNGNYKYKAYHLEDIYYTYVEKLGNFTVAKSPSSIGLDISDYAEFYYKNCSIPFNVVNRTIVRVLVTNENGSVVYIDKTVDHNSNHIAVDLIARDQYYKITVFNLDNGEIVGSQDSKFFRILKAGSSISIDDIGDVPYGKGINITFIVENKTSINVSVYDKDGNLVYEEITGNDSLILPVLPIGQYNITLINIGNKNVNESNFSATFHILKADNVVSVSANNVSYGDYTLVVVRAQVDGLYLLDVNGSLRNVSVADGIGRVYCSLPVGEYYTNVTFDDENCNNFISNAAFSVSKADNVVSVSANNVSYGDNVLVVVRAQFDGLYLLDVNGILSNVSVVNGIGSIDLSLPVGEYYANVTFDDENCNNFISNAAFSVSKADNYVSVYFGDVFSGDNVTVFINATADGIYLLDVNGSLSNVSVVGGIGSIELSLPAGEYCANVTFDNENYNSFITNATWFKPDNVTIPSGLPADGVGNIILDLPEGTVGNVEVYINNNHFATCPVSGGKNIIPLIVSDSGENLVTMIFVDEYGYTYEFSHMVYVKKPVSPLDVVFSDDSSIIEFTVHMPVDVTGVLYINLADNVYPVDIVDGEVAFSISGLPSGSYIVELDYRGDDRYESFLNGYFVEVESGNGSDNGSGNGSDAVPQKKATVIDCRNMVTTTVGIGVGGKYFKLVLKDAKGNALANKQFQIEFNGKVYKRTTNAKGVASIKIALKKKGTYSLMAFFLGDDKYNGSFAVAKVKVKPQKVKLTVKKRKYKAKKKTKYLYATLKTTKKKAIKGKKLIFIVNKKKYVAKTNKKGVAKVKIKLSKKKTYKFTVRFAGDATYASIKKSSKVSIK